MEPWALIEDSAFGPDAIKVIGQAFDEVWADIGGNCSSDAVREGAYQETRCENFLNSCNSVH